jgi:hypothetical protein
MIYLAVIWFLIGLISKNILEVLIDFFGRLRGSEQDFLWQINVNTPDFMMSANKYFIANYYESFQMLPPFLYKLEDLLGYLVMPICVVGWAISTFILHQRRLARNLDIDPMNTAILKAYNEFYDKKGNLRK